MTGDAQHDPAGTRAESTDRPRVLPRGAFTAAILVVSVPLAGYLAYPVAVCPSAALGLMTAWIGLASGAIACITLAIIVPLMWRQRRQVWPWVVGPFIAIYLFVAIGFSIAFRGLVEWSMRSVRESRWIHTVSDQMLSQLEDNAPMPGSLITLILAERVTPFPTEHWADSIRADEIVIGQYTWADYLSGAIQADDLLSEIMALARERAVLWENLGPILICLDENVWTTRNHRYPTIVARFQDQFGSPLLIAAFADGQIEYVHRLEGVLADGFRRLEEDSMMPSGSLSWESTIRTWLNE